MEPVVEQEQQSPRIIRIRWGRMEVEGLGAGKDFKLYPGGGHAWDRAETGTRHWPGIQPADVEELAARGATAVVLSQCRMSSRQSLLRRRQRCSTDGGPK